MHTCMNEYMRVSTDLCRDIAVGDDGLSAPAGGGKHRNIEQLRKRAHAWGSERRNTGRKGGSGGGGRVAWKIIPARRSLKMPLFWTGTEGVPEPSVLEWNVGCACCEKRKKY